MPAWRRRRGVLGRQRRAADAFVVCRVLEMLRIALPVLALLRDAPNCFTSVLALLPAKQRRVRLATELAVSKTLANPG